jgi:hypothetical protein
MSRTFYAFDYDTLKVAFFPSKKARDAALVKFVIEPITAKHAKECLRIEAANSCSAE